jgi:hypothetical protein
MHACKGHDAASLMDRLDHVAGATFALSPADSGPPASVTTTTHRTTADRTVLFL